MKQSSTFRASSARHNSKDIMHVNHKLTIALVLFSLNVLGQGLSREATPAPEHPMGAQEARQEAGRLKTEWLQETKAKYEKSWQEGSIGIGDRTMPFLYKEFGEKPADGYSLYISLHGGGSAPKEVNDQQWQNQIRLYEPANAIYVAPRAPYDDWDMWFKPGLDDFYQALTEMTVAIRDVNPDKVYLLGYSAGGDGVWRMAPRMADSWAAASMMAGHPGDVSLLNLRNLPFMNWCGALDGAYKRNYENRVRGAELDSLQRADPDGYIHETHIVQDKPHWMDRVDTVAVSWMAQYRRNPYPEKIVWRQEEVVHPHFYWLSAPKDELQRGKTVRLERKANRVNITQCDYSSLTLYFNDEMVNLDKKVVIQYNGKTLFKGKLQRTKENMRRTLHERGDLRYMFPSSVSVSLN